MTLQEYIVEVLEQAEKRLAARMNEAVEDRQYAAVAELAPVTQQVRDLIRSVDPGRTEPSREYPRFFRSRDRLVKVGWSRKSGKEYMHRASKISVRAVAAALRDRGSHEFSVSQLRPVRDGRGAEVPAYQVSLIVAWLRTLGAVRGAGRHHAVVPDRLSAAELEQHWNSLDVDASAKEEVGPLRPTRVRSRGC